ISSQTAALVQASLPLPGNHIASDNGANSGNFLLAAPVVNLPGRGLDLALSLNYNARVWQKAGSNIYFDIDADWPAPGWSLGFGKLILIGNNESMLEDADGTRHPYAGKVNTYRDGTADFAAHTTDGSLIDYLVRLDKTGNMLSAQARYP